MDQVSTPSEEQTPGDGAKASTASKAESYVVNFPLTPEELEWLKAQSRRVREAVKRFLASEGKI